MAKPKQFTRPPKKQKAKAAEPETADEFQEAADFEEDTGGKWRAGDPAKSGRAFVRALEIYDKGLQKHPADFDLAYNKARLEFEVTQQPIIVSHTGVPLVDLLTQTLESHRYALRLKEENPDILFNTSQVLTSLAEQLSERDEPENVVPLLREALELLSACCSRQEMMLEQQQVDFENAEEGGVALDPDEKLALTPRSDQSEQTATIENPVTVSDLLDTIHASLSALTTLVVHTEPHALQTLGDMAHSLTESKAPAYIALLPENTQHSARFNMALDRANFIAAFAYAQYHALQIETETYLDRLNAFDIPGKEANPTALSSEAEARTEFVTTLLARFNESPTELPVDVCWKQLTLSQSLYTQATNLGSSAQIYLSRGDVEMLRHRIAILPPTRVKLAESVRKSAATLVRNAQTYYIGAMKLASDAEVEVRSQAQQWNWVTTAVRATLYGVERPATAVRLGKVEANAALQGSVEEGLLPIELAEEIARYQLPGGREVVTE